MGKDLFHNDLFHNIVKEALITEGWTVTHDPLPVSYGDVQIVSGSWHITPGYCPGLSTAFNSRT